jgi:hypothetical protein
MLQHIQTSPEFSTVSREEETPRGEGATVSRECLVEQETLLGFLKMESYV